MTRYFIDVIARTNILQLLQNKFVRGNLISKVGLAASAFTLKLCIVGLLAMTAVPAHAAFEDNGTGARPVALGNAYSALGDDILSLYYNPASLARIQQPEISTEYSRLYTGLSDGSNLGQYLFSAGIPMLGGVVGVGWKQLNLADLYQERTLTIGYGRWLNTHIAIGISAKQLHHAFEAPSTTVDDNGNELPGTPSLFTEKGTGSSVMTGDAGLLYRLGRYQWLGVSALNLNAPNVALDEAASDHVARTYRAGWAYQDTHKFSVASEFEYEDAPDSYKDKHLSIGTEKGWDLNELNAVFVRGAFTGGTRQLRRISSGAGLKLGALVIDYAFVFDLSGVAIGQTMGTHRLSLSYRFDGQRPAPVINQNVPPKENAPSVMNVPEKDLDALSFEEMEGPGKSPAGQRP